VLAAPGTSLIDTYLNLQLVRQGDPLGRKYEIPTTLFLQYQQNGHGHREALPINVSAMNTHVETISATLADMGWDNSQNWLVLWISNGPILEDAIPHSKLLWVGKDNLERHCPLIARRGQVMQEEDPHTMFFS
jgi:hypothetical protein